MTLWFGCDNNALNYFIVLQKFQSFLTVNNLMARLQAKYDCIEKALADSSGLDIQSSRYATDSSICISVMIIQLFSLGHSVI
jgi:hypothetical protein